MIFRMLLGLSFFLIVFSCADQTSKIEQQKKNSANVKLGSKSGLQFDIARYRGTEYRDSLGIEYNLRYRPITISNDTTISIHFQLTFFKEYAYGAERFRLIPLPREWGIDGGNWDMMWKEFPNYLDNPILDKTIEPGEKIVIAIGELVSRPPQFSISINSVFALTKIGVFPTCEWRMKEEPTSNSEIALGLELDFGESCRIIPCGQISYPKQRNNMDNR